MVMAQQPNEHMQHYSEDAYYINAELSLLDFHVRVLAQAVDPLHPLLERLNFLIIFSRNLDEFFEVHLAKLLQQCNQMHQSQPNFANHTLLLTQIFDRTQAAVKQQYQILNQHILPALTARNIHVLSLNPLTQNQINPQQSNWTTAYFMQLILPNLQPVILHNVEDNTAKNAAKIFLNISNKQTNLIVKLRLKEAASSSQTTTWAVVPVPSHLQPLVFLPPTSDEDPSVFCMLLATLIQTYLAALFVGWHIVNSAIFRVTYAANESSTVDPAHRPPMHLHSGLAVRLEIEKQASVETTEYLASILGLSKAQIYFVDGIIDLTELTGVYNAPDLGNHWNIGAVNSAEFKQPIHIKEAQLKYPPFTPYLSPSLTSESDIFFVIRQRDILLHHPFDSFAPVIHLLRAAAHDPQVSSIYQTLYRSGVDSEIVQQLITAAQHGKQVTVVVELRVRQDEQNNWQIAQKLQQAGVRVVYGNAQYKTHAKMLLITRREQHQSVRYVHLGTGNYHAVNAQLYTDYGLLSSDTDLADDVGLVFEWLINSTDVQDLSKSSNGCFSTTLNQTPQPLPLLHFKKILVAPFNLYAALIGFIEHEMTLAQAGLPAHIIIKANALTQPQLIDALYRASEYGVKVDLIIRSICSLRPQVAGLSKKISVRSIVGRFLEHTRVFYFSNAGAQPRLYCGSADLMDRNMFARVEVCFPIENDALQQRIIQYGLLNYMQDNQQAWTLKSNGVWERVTAHEHKTAYSAQQVLLDKLSR